MQRVLVHDYLSAREMYQKWASSKKVEVLS